MVKFYYDNVKLQKLLLLNAVLLSAVIMVGNYTPQYMWFVSVVAVSLALCGGVSAVFGAD